MSLIERIRSFADERIQARNRMRTYRLIQSLPDEIQRDIGWPDGPNARRLRRHAEHDLG